MANWKRIPLNLHGNKKFQNLAGISLKDPTIGSEYRIATGNDFESHDGMTEELYQRSSVLRTAGGNHLPVDLQPPVPRSLAR